MKNKLLIFDLDGTLFDTKEVNCASYQEAILTCGYKETIDYKYFCEFCNGNNYKTFIPQIIKGIDINSMEKIHNAKKALYNKHLSKARKNEELFNLIKNSKDNSIIAMVTSASKQNTMNILEFFNVSDLFDIIITQEDVKKQKPDPECFILAMEKANISSNNTTIYEDSENGIKAAELSGASYIKVIGYN